MVFTIVTFILFTALVAIISWYLTKNDNLNTESGYFLGGRSLSATVIAGSMMLTNLSTEQMVGLNAQGFKSGLSVIAWESGASIGIVILALYFLPKYLQGSITTVPEFLEERYDKTVRNIVSVFFLLTLGVAFLPTVLYSGSIAMMRLFNIPELLNISPESAIILSVWMDRNYWKYLCYIWWIKSCSSFRYCQWYRINNRRFSYPCSWIYISR